MKQELFSTRHTKYGHGIDVRATYEHLPLQGFWTWVTGKSGNRNPPKSAKETLLKPWQLFLQISWGYAVFVSAVLLGNTLLQSDLHWAIKVLLSVPMVCMVVNRQRGLLHTFHYTIHGAGVANKRLAKFVCKWVLSMPIVHTPWNNYMKLHVSEHHSVNTFCTDKDVDLQFMAAHGFYKGMSETEYWTRLVLAPFHPMRIYEHIKFRLEVNFVKTDTHERISRTIYWLLLLTGVYLSGYMVPFAVFYLMPIFLVTQFSSWIQHVTEHLWFSENTEGLPKYVFYGSLSWGRFFGRPYPAHYSGWAFTWRVVKWGLAVVCIDIPLRVFSFMQDLPSHDFHHRNPGVNFWSIAPERAANESLASRFGPMTETWSMTESFLILRDHLCRNESDPFGISTWYHTNKQHLETKNARQASVAEAEV